MTQIDLRDALNAISDVVVNRPPPLREFDQIYMKVADMLLQAEHLSRWLNGKSVILIGDGDAIGLSMMHLAEVGVLTSAPSQVHVIDFDERVVNSITMFAKNFGLEDQVSAELYNVVDPLPPHLRGTFDAFYSNPPFGASNGGKSVEAFIMRGIEACHSAATACIAVADDPSLEWTQDVLASTQRFLRDQGFVIKEMLPEFHHYHLDDNPNLTSCSLVAARNEAPADLPDSIPLPPEFRKNFYGDEAPLRIRYVRDRRKGGTLSSRDHYLEPLGE